MRTSSRATNRLGPEGLGGPHHPRRKVRPIKSVGLILLRLQVDTLAVAYHIYTVACVAAEAARRPHLTAPDVSVSEVVFW